MAVFRRWDGRSAPTGPQRSGGRRQPSFLAREECASAQGKKVGEAVAGTRPAGARPATKRGHLGGSGHSLPRENDAGSVTPPAENACRQIQPATTSKGAIQPKHDTSGSPVRRRSAVGQERTGKAGARDAVHRIPRRLEQTAAVYGALFARREAISESGALNRPRRNSGGTTASTASSFSLGSMRR